MYQRYILFYKANEAKPIGAMLIQLKRLKLGESLRFKDNQGKKLGEKVSDGVKKFVAKFVEFDTLICGNVLLTGEYGYTFVEEEGLSRKSEFNKIEKSLSLIAKILKKDGFKVGPILMKDYYKETAKENKDTSLSGFSDVEVQPNMVLNIRPEWKTFDDYLASMKSKYRVRYRRANKKLVGVEKKVLDLNEIAQYKDILYKLYQTTADDAGFNLFTLPPNYFLELKKYLQDKVKIVGYFKGEELIGYYTIIYNKAYMEAHYLGYKKEYNHDLQTYLNMLYDLIREGIEVGTTKVQFARTAMEIKSSVGAEPYDMVCYLKHHNGMLNKLVNPVMNVFKPEDKWTQRMPFK